MDNVQRKLKDNFLRWRVENQKNLNTMEAMKEDMREYMQKTFQIKLEETSMSETKPVNILDILDTMIVPNVEASVADRTFGKKTMWILLQIRAKLTNCAKKLCFIYLDMTNFI